MPTSRRFCNGIVLNVLEEGPADGPLLILLHGFPDFSLGWRRQIPALAAAGFHVVVPDQRGYNLSDHPAGIAAYDLDKLAGDVLALADSFAADRFGVVGHDWGASVAWWLVSTAPGRIDRATMINAPHPAIWRDAMQHDAEQRRLSGYVRFLALPWLPEWVLRRNGFAALAQSLRGAKSPPGAAELDLYRAAWAQPGALTAMINWYRALLRRQFVVPAPASLATPIQIIWGRRDPYGLPALADRSAALCTDPRLVFLDEATHWAMWDEPERVNALLLDFFGKR